VGRRLLREVGGIIGAVVALVLLASFLSYSSGSSKGNLCGPVGHAVADVLISAFGWAAYFIPLYLGLLASWAFRDEGRPALPAARLAGCAMLVLAISTALAVFREGRPGVAPPSAGVLGGFVAAQLRGVLGTFGAALVTLALLLLAALLATEASLPAVSRRLRELSTTFAAAAAERAPRTLVGEPAQARAAQGTPDGDGRAAGGAAHRPSRARAAAGCPDRASGGDR
jgi:hypothetical protein